MARTFLSLLSIPALLLGQLPLLRGLDRARAEVETRSASFPVETAAVLAGFRGIVLDLLYLKAEGDLRRGDLWALPDDYRLIAGLEPQNEEIWEFLAYQLAYNVADEERGSRWYWIREGLALCEEGLRRLPSSFVLHRLKGQIYSRRLHDPAFAFLKEAVLAEEGRRDLDVAVLALADAARLAGPEERTAARLQWAVVEIERADELAREGDLEAAVRGFDRARVAILEVLENPGGPGDRPAFAGVDFEAALTRVSLAIETLSWARRALEAGKASSPELTRALRLVEDAKKSALALGAGGKESWLAALEARLRALARHREDENRDDENE